ncbi:MAG: asparagine synthase (glutamine-hydrolyzing) [Kiloniellaceae bacterium]
MCGIVAILSRNGPVSMDAMNRAVAQLHHRGPDGQGSWLSPDGRAALGHARLSIIDLETGAQPIANEDETVHIAVNGEFYDFERARRALEMAGHRFRTRSDSEIALHLYEEHGVEAVRHLRGEFAFTLWDQSCETLFAFRDRYGVKPLYYSLYDGDLYVASEMKALFAAGVPARWDLESVYLGVALRGPSRTLFQDVFAVPPGHFLMATRDGFKLVEYWDIDYPATGADVGSLPEQDLVRQFRALLDESVRLRLRADVPVACYLSGGLDSCAILGLAAQLRSDPVRTFTLRFAGEAYDEGAIAQEMADRAGAEHTAIDVREDDLADDLEESVFHAEGPCTNAHGIAKFRLSRHLRDAGFNVVLTGEGADEVLAGYPHFRQDSILHGSDDAGRDEVELRLKELRDSNKVSLGRLLPEASGAGSPLLRKRLGFIPSWLDMQFAAVASRRMPLAYSVFADVAKRDPAQVLVDGLDLEARLKNRHAVDQAAYLWAKTMLPNYILATLGDRMEMAHSIEGRVPFLDHRVCAFLDRVPPGMKIHGRVEKYLLRMAARDVLTDRVYRRQKHPFLSPPLSLLRGSRFYDLTQDTLRSKIVESVPFLDAPLLRSVADKLIDATERQRRAAEPRVLFVMGMIFLHRRFGVQS